MRSARAELLHEAADSGQPAAMFHLGELYRLGHGVPPSASQAETWLRRAVARGHVKALLSLVQLFDTGPEPDANTAAVLCRQAAELGDGEAQYRLGQYYLAGKGVPPTPWKLRGGYPKRPIRESPPPTKGWARCTPRAMGFRRISKRRPTGSIAPRSMGDASALYHLGTLQMRGLGTQRDPDSALARYQSAAEKGSGAASLQLGIIYASGEEVPQDYAEAARWYYSSRRAGFAGRPL